MPLAWQQQAQMLARRLEFFDCFLLVNSDGRERIIMQRQDIIAADKISSLDGVLDSGVIAAKLSYVRWRRGAGSIP